MRPWTTSDCKEQSKPPGYNFDGTEYHVMTQANLTHLSESCARTEQGYKDPLGCHHSINLAENALIDLFWASDLDLMKIYRHLFGCNGFLGVPLVVTLQKDYQTLLANNATIFGSRSDPGLLNDLYSVMDGIEQIKSVADAQLQAVQAASNSQVAAAQRMEAEISDTSSEILGKTLQLMQSLVGNRTLSQTRAYAVIDKSVSNAVEDISTQAESIQESFASQIGQLSERYQDWAIASEKGISDVTDRAKELKNVVNQAGKITQQFTSELLTTELANTATSINAASAEADSDMASAQTGIADDMSNLASDMAKALTLSRSQFSQQVNALSRTIGDRTSRLRASIASSSSVAETNAADSKGRADAALSKIRAFLHSNIDPLIQDVKTAMDNAVKLSNNIEAVRAQLNADIVALRQSGLEQASNLGNKVVTTFSGIQKDFTEKFKATDSGFQQQLTAKVEAGRGELSKMLETIHADQSSAAGEQAVQGQATRDQAAASMTAASLISTRETSAADTTKAGLSTMVGVVGAALQDSQATINGISRANIDNIASVNKQISRDQASAILEAYNRIRSSDQSAISRNAAVQADSFDAQLSGQSVEQSIAESGAELDTSVKYQNRQAQALLADITDIMNVAMKNGGTLQEQMSAFEKQAPALFALLQQKISAYKALLVSQGQQAQHSAADLVSNLAQSDLIKLASSIQEFSASQMGVSPALSADKNSVATDSASLIHDIEALNRQLDRQSNAGAAFITASAQAASDRSIRSINQMSEDSAAALSALVRYNSDLVNQKRAQILSSGDIAMTAAIRASDDLTARARRFVDMSEQFVAIATSLGGQASQNLSGIVDSINRTLVEVTSSADTYMSRLNGAAGSIASWPSQIMTKSSQINTAIQSKAAEITSAVLAIAESNTPDNTTMRQSIKDLQRFVEELTTAFNKQREIFNEFANKFAVRRIQLLNELNETIAVQHNQFLSGLASTDLKQAQKASTDGETIQTLMASLDKAKSEGTVDMHDVQAVMDKMDSGMSGLVHSFSTQMGLNIDELKQKATKDAILSQQGIRGTVGHATTSADLLAGRLADAFDSLSKSSLAGEAAAAGSSKDVYAIAGLLSSSGQETQKKVAALLRVVESGSTTFDEALNAAKNMTQRDVTTVLDILDVFAGYSGSYIDQVYQFNSTVKESIDALNKTAINALLRHVELNAQSLADMAIEQYKLGNLSETVLSHPARNYTGILDTVQAKRNQSIIDVENYMSSVLHGDLSNLGAFLQVKRHMAPVSVADSINQASKDFASAKTRVAVVKNDMDNHVTSLIAKANAAVADILNITRVALAARG